MWVHSVLELTDQNADADSTPDCMLWSEADFDDDTAAIYLQYLKGLIHLGVPLNDVEDFRHE